MTTSSGIRLIVGLGNPGSEYIHTRHNAGTWLVNQLAAKAQMSLNYDKKFFASSATLTSPHTHYIMIPDTFMNESGRAVLALAHYYKILPEHILVAHDELDFAPGTVRIKQGGGHGGHNGLRDIIHSLHSPDFYRLRIGIGHPGHKDRVSSYVLSKPSSSDLKHIEDSIIEACTVMPLLIEGQLQRAFHKLHSD